MIRGIKETKKITKHISCECKYKFDVRKCNSNQKWNNDKCRCECKNPRKHHVCRKKFFFNPATCSCINSKYLASIIDNSVIMCDEIIEETKTATTNFNKKMESLKPKISIFYLPFY